MLTWPSAAEPDVCYQFFERSVGVGAFQSIPPLCSFCFSFSLHTPYGFVKLCTFQHSSQSRDPQFTMLLAAKSITPVSFACSLTTHQLMRMTRYKNHIVSQCRIPQSDSPAGIGIITSHVPSPITVVDQSWFLPPTPFLNIPCCLQKGH